MSATGRGAERQEADFYATPAWCVWRLLERLPLPHGDWLDPCIGDGAIPRAVRDWPGNDNGRLTPRWTGVELRHTPLHTSGLVAAYHRADFVERDCPPLGQRRFDVCLTNPPYSLALDFVRHARRRARIVAMLLRLNWLESDDRAWWLDAHPSNTPDVYVLPNRPSFKGNGTTDATAYAWMVWTAGRQRPAQIQVLDPTPLAVRRAFQEAA